MELVHEFWFTLQDQAVYELGTELAKNMSGVAPLLADVSDNSSAAGTEFGWTIRSEEIKVIKVNNPVLNFRV
jgi:hypothetical protein